MENKSKDKKKTFGRGKPGVKGGPRAKRMRLKKSRCKVCASKSVFSHLDPNLRKFTTERGKILPSRITGNCAKHQRQLAKAIKRARHAGLLPYLAA